MRRVEVAEDGGAWREAWRGAGTSARLDGLAPGQAHAFRVRAANAAGEGPPSREAAAATLLCPPRPPAGLALEPCAECAPWQGSHAARESAVLA
jgi:hypothetical protein